MQAVTLGHGFIRATAMVAALLAFTTALSANDPVREQSDEIEHLKSALQSRVPQIQIEAVRRAPWLGMYEVLTPSEIVYSDAKGDLLFFGKIVDTQKREDLTAKRWEESLRIDFRALPFDKAIKIVKGNGARQLAVFEDPECPFCQRFEQALDGLKDTTVYIFLLPIAELHPNAAALSRDIWCAGDKAAAWSEWMLKKVKPPAAVDSCAADPVSDLVALGEKLKITGTPTLFFVDGMRIPGAVTAEQLEAAFAERVAAK